MAEFFGGMQEKTSGRVEIQEMEPTVFAAMLGFIYTDAVPELDQKMEVATATLAQHLLAATDRFGLAVANLGFGVRVVQQDNFC